MHAVKCSCIQVFPDTVLLEDVRKIPFRQELLHLFFQYLGIGNHLTVKSDMSDTGVRKQSGDVSGSQFHIPFRCFLQGIWILWKGGNVGDGLKLSSAEMAVTMNQLSVNDNAYIPGIVSCRDEIECTVFRYIVFHGIA